MKLFFELNNPKKNLIRAEDFEIFKQDMKEFVVEDSNETLTIEIRQAKMIELVETQMDANIEDLRACADCGQIIKIYDACSCWDFDAYVSQEMDAGDFYFEDLSEDVQARVQQDAEDWVIYNTIPLDNWTFEALQIFFEEVWGPAVELVKIER